MATTPGLCSRCNFPNPANAAQCLKCHKPLVPPQRQVVKSGVSPVTVVFIIFGFVFAFVAGTYFKTQPVPVEPTSRPVIVRQVAPTAAPKVVKAPKIIKDGAIKASAPVNEPGAQGISEAEVQERIKVANQKAQQRERDLMIGASIAQQRESIKQRALLEESQRQSEAELEAARQQWDQNPVRTEYVINCGKLNNYTYTLNDHQGNTIQNTGAQGPRRFTFLAPHGGFAYISTQSDGYARDTPSTTSAITVEIWCAGRLMKRATSHGSYAIAQADCSIP